MIDIFHMTDISMSHLIKVLLVMSSLSLFQCTVITNYLKNISALDYHVTYTRLSVCHNVSNLKRGFQNVNCEIELEKNLVLKVVLQLKKVELVNSKTKFLVCEENETCDCTKRKQNNFDVVEGFVISKQDSSVNGYIKNDSFYGTLFIDNITYHIEELQSYPDIYGSFRNSGQNAVIFKEVLNMASDLKDSDEPINIAASHNLRNLIGTGKLCALFVLIDHSFVKLVHNGDVNAAVAQVLSVLDVADTIFRSTDFDGDGYPDNIGFTVRHLVVLKSEGGPMDILRKFTENPALAREYLDTFARYEILREVCEGVAFTGQEFKNHVVGHCYISDYATANHAPDVGGICERPIKQSGISYNSLVIAPRNKGTILSHNIMSVCLAHELGHGFGCFHDNERPNCKRGHIMESMLPPEKSRKPYSFSSCSKVAMSKVLLAKGYCFENYEDPFCGNGIAEQGEDCDCGTARNCDILDPCCFGRGHKNACKLNKTKDVDCHPQQGLCCTSECKYKDLSHFNLNCTNFEKTCPCQGSDSCTCGVEGECTKDVCNSQECTRLSLSECKCPVEVAQGKCRICCTFQGSCQPSHIVTKTLINNDKSLISALKKHERIKRINTEFGFYKRFCDGTSCVELYFGDSPVSGYCLLFGKVGYCTKDFSCVAHIYKISDTSGRSYRKCANFILMILSYSLVYIFYIFNTKLI